MSHYSEMNFLFNPINSLSVTDKIVNNSNGNVFNIFKDKNRANRAGYTVFKNDKKYAGTEDIKNYIKESIYDKKHNSNPYVDLLTSFNKTQNTAGAGLRLKPSDFAYLRDLGVYPINRMIILRRFPEGLYVPEDLNTFATEPISTIIGWIKPDQNFGSITVNEGWTKTTERFDVVMSNIIKNSTGGVVDIAALVPIPDFAQGMLFAAYKNMGLLNNSGDNDNTDEINEYYDMSSGGSETWGLKNIPVGDPNVLQEAPFRDPVGQNIQSDFNFEFETVYEQKLIGDVDPGNAMMDILDNIYAMGTSNMTFYWGDDSAPIKKAKKAAFDKGNNLRAWWDFVKEVATDFWKTMMTFLTESKDAIKKTFEDISSAYKTFTNVATDTLQSILTSTISIHRFRIRGSIELMVGGKDSSAPWHLTIGNPLLPWINTSHIIVKSVNVETSNELGFNDMPQRLTAKFNCQLSRSLGKQELMRMFNNSYRRTYSKPIKTPIEQNKQPINDPSLNKLKTTDVAPENKGYLLPELIVVGHAKTPGSNPINDPNDPSIVNYLQNKGQDYSYSARKNMANEMGIKNYRGTADQNTYMLNTLREKK